MSDENNNQRSLGRGLRSLLGGKKDQQEYDKTSIKNIPYFPKTTSGVASQILQIEIDKIKTNPHQPRQTFEEHALAELVESIKEHGILQPLIVTQVLGGEYELIAGERRLKAAKKAGLSKVPVIVRTAKELEKLELSLIENIQRQDLNPIERAQAYQKLISDFNLTQEEIAKKLSKARSSVANSLRLLTLPASVQEALKARKITEGQAKILLELKEREAQEKIFEKINRRGLTVEETQREVSRVKVKSHYRRVKKEEDLTLNKLVDELESYLGTKVEIQKKFSGQGEIKIDFYSAEELKGIVKRIIKGD